MLKLPDRRILQSVAVFCVVAAAVAIFLLVLPEITKEIRTSTDTWAVFARLYLPLVISVVVAYWTAKRVYSLLSKTKVRTEVPSRLLRLAGLLRELALAALAISYAATWAFGVPAVETDLTDNTIKGYKFLVAQSHGRGMQDYPYQRSTVSFPLAPGVIATYYEYQVAGLEGLGAWYFHFWYFSGVKELGIWQFWIS